MNNLHVNVSRGLKRFCFAIGASLAMTAVSEAQLAPAVAQPPSFQEPEMVRVPGGSFVMGSPDNENGRRSDEGPQHTVTVPAFEVGKYEVTFAEWDACVADGGCYRYRPADEGWGRGRKPAINVSFNDANAFLKWLSDRTGSKYRLLTEAEWEYAARAGTQTAYSWGANPNGGCSFGNGADMSARREDRTWTTSTCDDGVGQRTAVTGHYRANPFGIHDMQGNVWEWVQGCYADNYSRAPGAGQYAFQEEPCGPGVIRGGSWYDVAQDLRSASRFRADYWARLNVIGFRVARTL